MSLFGRALGGAAQGVVALSNKYLDDEILTQRAQAIADIQRESAVKQEGQLDAQRNAPDRIARDRSTKVGDITAVGQATNQVQLEGERARASDQTITDGLVGRAKATAQAQSDVNFEGQKRALTELGGLEVDLAGQKARASAEATYSTQAKYREKPKGETTLAQKIAQVEDAVGRKLSQTEREALAGLGDKKSDPLKKLVDESTQEALKAGVIQPEDAGKFADKIRQGFSTVQVQTVMAPRIAAARKDGAIGEAVDELRGLGYSDDQMRGFGVMPEELKASGKPAAQKEAPRAPSRSTPVPDNGGDEVAAARAELQRYGLVQRAKDPAGFAAAQQRLRDAEQQQQASAGPIPAGMDRPSFRMAAP